MALEEQTAGGNPFTVATGETISPFQMVCINAAGDAIEAGDIAGAKCVGVSKVAMARTAGEKIAVVRGVFGNLKTNSITKASIGLLAYVNGVETVDLIATTTNDVVAGVIVGFENDLVTVDFNIQSV